MEQAQLGYLQDLILERGLATAPLPGQDTAISFPDLAYVTRAETALVSADGYVGRSGRVEVVDPGNLSERIVSGETGYFEFQQPSETGDAVTIRLRVLLGFADLEPLPLGELVVTFVEEAGSWTTIYPTHAVAF